MGTIDTQNHDNLYKGADKNTGTNTPMPRKQQEQRHNSKSINANIEHKTKQLSEFCQNFRLYNSCNSFVLSRKIGFTTYDLNTTVQITALL